MGGPRRIGVMTSGGDCAGLNAAIRAVVQRAVHGYGWEVVGILNATHGFLSEPCDTISLTLESVSGKLPLGGTMLGTTNYGNPFAYPDPDGTVRDRSQDVVDAYHRLGLSALVAIGGDGSMAIMNKLAKVGQGMNLVAIPKTIDNDLGGTELAIGFTTAVNVATEALDRLRSTAESHRRVMILEVMGRDAGHIALSAGIAGGAKIILIPEIPYDIDKVCAKILDRQKRGLAYTLAVVAEGVKNLQGETVAQQLHRSGLPRLGGIGDFISDRISGKTGLDTRVTVLGHLQRGGTPSATDRLVATAFGVKAVDLIAEEKYGHMVGWRNRSVDVVPIDEAIASYSCVDCADTLIHTARGMGICLGD
ncbi:MAG: ATP-dependent 6-phosphofructokinase [Cyanobacteria bacterium P01_G01_bin.4]